MNTHTRPEIMAALDGIYKLDEWGHWVPVEPEDEHYPYPILIIIGLCAIAWSAIAAGYWLVG